MPDAELCIWRHKEGELPAEATGIELVYSLSDALNFAPDAVFVSSPAPFHAAQCSAFAKAGIPIFVEKPVEVRLDALVPFSDALAQGKGLVFVGYVLRFQPMLGALKQGLENGLIGKILTAHISTGQYLPDWRPDSDYRSGVSANASLGGGVLLELSHELDYASWLFGQPETVFADASKLSDLEIDVEDSATIVLGYSNRRVVVNVDFLQRTAAMSLRVVGSEATLVADLIAETATLHTPTETKTVDIPVLETGNEMYLRQFDAFFAQAFADYNPRFTESRSAQFATFDDAAAVLRLVEKAKEAAMSGQRISV